MEPRFLNADEVAQWQEYFRTQGEDVPDADDDFWLDFTLQLPSDDLLPPKQ